MGASESCRESVTDMGHGDIWQMAQSAGLCLLYSHWSREEEEKRRLIPAASGAGDTPPLPRSLQAHLSPCTAGNIHRLFGLDQRRPSPGGSCGLAGPRRLLLAFLERAKAAAFTEYTARSPCLRSSAPPLSLAAPAGRCYLSAASRLHLHLHLHMHGRALFAQMSRLDSAAWSW